jgi:hypothetical protein
MTFGNLIFRICFLAVNLLVGNEVIAQNVLMGDQIGSKPQQSVVPNVLKEKGKRPGLLFHLKCVDSATKTISSDVCFPISTTATTDVKVTIGNNANLPCSSTPGNPGTCTCSATAGGPGSCSYSLVDAFHHANTCGLASNQPCVDTVKIVYNGIFPSTTNVTYTVSHVQGVSGQAQILGNNFVTFATTSNVPPTVSLEFVFDISGSMGLPTVQPASSGTPTRMQALQYAAQTPLGLLSLYSLPGTTLLPGDKVGAVFFASKANPDPTSGPPCGVSTSNLLQAADPTNVTSVSGQIQSQGPTSATSIGAGLQSAKTCGFDRENAPANTNKTVLLFSDGEQNTSPSVTVSGGQVSIGSNTYDSSIRVCPITAGRLTAPGFKLQQDIADAKCAGYNAHIRDTDQTFALSDLQSFFAYSLSAILPTDKLEVVVDTIGSVSRERSTVERFQAANNDGSLTIIVSLVGSEERERTLPFRLRAPDGTVVDTSKNTRIGDRTSFTMLTFPLYQGGHQINQSGEWQILFDGRNLHSKSVNYHLMVLSDNPTIVSELAVDAADVGTAEPIPIRLKLSDNGVPVRGAKVEVQLIGPRNSLGNVLSTTPVSVTGAPNSPDTPSSKGQAKLDALYNTPANARLFADIDLPTLTLVDRNNSGTYTGSVNNTSNEGHYYLSVKVLGSSSVAGRIQRAFRVARFVRPKPDSKNTVLKLLRSDAQPDGSVLVTLQATPHDRLGNFLGPGYDHQLRISASDGKLERPIDDRLDGSYQVLFRLPSRASNPTFTLEIMGTPVTKKTLKELSESRDDKDRYIKPRITRPGRS